MYNKIKIFSFLLVLIFMSSCIDEIQLDIDNVEQRLAVDGLIADSLDTYSIRIFKSAIIGRGNDNVFDPVSGASVQVFDDAGNVYEFLETTPGYYTKEMQGVSGRSYYVEVKTPDEKTIRSKPAIMTKSPKIDTITSEIFEETFLNSAGNAVVQQNVTLRATTSFEEFTEKPFLRWRTEGEYEFKENYPMALNTKICYVKNDVDLNNLKIFDTRILSSNEISNEPFVTTKLNYRFAYQYCFHVQQYSMTEEEYNYWVTVNDVTNIDGSFFDPPPGTVRGNLFNVDDPDDEIVGYFSVSGLSAKRFFANPQSLNQVFIEPKCFASPWRPTTPDCYDCTTIYNSSLTKPDYWEP